MKKLIIICILYSSSLLGMDSPFEVPHLLQQLTTKDVTILENIVHEASATTKSQNEELSNTLACIEKIRTIKEAIYTHDREESILNMLDYAYTFVENPQSISFVRTIFEDLKKSEFPENVSDAWHLRKNIILDTASKIQKRKSEDVQLLRDTVLPYLEAGSEPRLRHILTYAEEIAQRAAENHTLLVTFQKHIDSLADDTP